MGYEWHRFSACHVKPDYSDSNELVGVVIEQHLRESVQKRPTSIRNKNLLQ